MRVFETFEDAVSAGPLFELGTTIHDPIRDTTYRISGYRVDYWHKGYIFVYMLGTTADGTYGGQRIERVLIDWEGMKA